MKKIIVVILALICVINFNVRFYTVSAEDFLEKSSECFSNYLNSVEDLIFIIEDEQVDICDASAYDVFLLIETYADSSEFVEPINDSQHASIDEELQIYRESQKDYYSTYNEEVVRALDISTYNYCSSFYSPYIEIVFDDIFEYNINIQNLIDAINDNKDKIASVSNYIIFRSSGEATVNDFDDAWPYPLVDAFDDIGVNNSNYTGEGIIVGVLDTGVPDTTINLKEGKYTFLSAFADNHATVTTSIIGGTSGIAEDVYFYCKELTGLVDDCNDLIDIYHANIINISMNLGTRGYYSRTDACVDNIVENTNCTIVTSAGNRGDGDKIVTAPGCSFNAITVGAVSENLNIADISSWYVKRPYLYKPDVVAPGDYLCNIGQLPNQHDNTYGYLGTSCSAPMVTGTIALLMEEFPMLKTNAALVKSIIHLGADQVPTQTNYFDEQAGFGLINYQNMRECLLNSNYSNFTISDDAQAGDIVLVESVLCAFMEKIEVNANLIVNSSETQEGNVEIIPYYTDYIIKLYDCQLESYVAISQIDSSIDYLVYQNTNANSMEFRIEIVLEEDNTGGLEERGTIAYNQHIHSYTSRYIRNSDMTHWSYCVCGERISQPHVVSSSHSTICILCRGMAGGGLLNSIPCNLPHTENGSYILPSGIIVLVPEDEEAYLNGTLEFRTGEIM